MTSTPTDEPLGDAGVGPSKTEEADLKDSSERDGKRPEESQEPAISIATELRELINRQDQLLLLLKQSLILKKPQAQGDGAVRTDGSDSDDPNRDIPCPEEVEENNRYAASYHVDLTLDTKFQEVLKETVNIFLAAFQPAFQPEGISARASGFSADSPWKWGVFGTALHVPIPSATGASEKPILLLKGSGFKGEEVFDVEWDGLEEAGSGSVTSLAKVEEVLVTEWRKPPPQYEFSPETILLNYDINRNPAYFYDKDKSHSFPYRGVFGTIFICRADNSFISLRKLAFTLHHLDARRAYLLNGSPASPDKRAASLHHVSLRSIKAFAGAWLEGQSHASWSLYKSGFHIFLTRGSSGWNHIVQSFRFLQISPRLDVEVVSDSSRSQGIQCIRVDGSLQLPHGHKLKAFKLVEGRYTIAVTTTTTLRSPVYSITLLSDDENKAAYRFGPELDQKIWQESKFRLGVYCKGITVFQLVLFEVIKAYSDAWTRSLDAIDQMVQVLPANILDDKSRRDLMFDRSLEKSGLYFAVLQILRIMGEWISESVTDLEKQKQSWVDFRWAGDTEYLSERAFESDRVAISSNWELLRLHHANLVKVLQDRIERKTKEVESLRAGLFNATQVREATRATNISQYIFVFTVMTIFYLPLTFVAALFGMHLFDGADLKETQRSFYISAVLIAILTYVLSGLAVWWVGDLEREQELKERWQEWKTKRLNKKTKFKDSGKTHNEKTGGAHPSKKESEHIWLQKLLHRGKQNGAEPAPPSP